MSCNKVKADDMCAQDLSNTKGVNVPVAGSLRVWQLYGDKDKRDCGQRWSMGLGKSII